MNILEHTKDKLVLEVKRSEQKPIIYTFHPDGNYKTSNFSSAMGEFSLWKLNADGVLIFRRVNEDDQLWYKFNAGPPNEVRWMSSVVANWLLENVIL